MSFAKKLGSSSKGPANPFADQPPCVFQEIQLVKIGVIFTKGLSANEETMALAEKIASMNTYPDKIEISQKGEIIDP